jgi:hypothetical protein
MAPEVVLLIAAGQWSFAHDSWLEMREILENRDAGVELTSTAHQSSSKSDAVAEYRIEPFSEQSGNAVAGQHVDKRRERASHPEKTAMTRPRLRRVETVEQCKMREKDERWTLRHAFYANMGGFRLRDRTGRIFLIGGPHINYLVRKQYIGLPNVSTLEINDRSKSDSLAKFLV